ncbi:chymotrypsin C [Fistulifera solaris]|uniref:Chymotrypsin C n=1 Tax=Fistulifera solaris TaxID=1519565 RepID=A0A1Z5KNA2_FISSO|nr:chymotrypsin C [Fistulifera solaris]|eukprot:GAX27794.1 chymotrypsin C [Fistulifera solaris]
MKHLSVQLFVPFLSLSTTSAAYDPIIAMGVLDDGTSSANKQEGSVRSSSMSSEKPNNLVEAYIVGGREAQRGDYPWIIKSVTGFGTCSATLIHSDMALTAAHCQGVFGGGVYVSAYDYNHINDGSIFREVDRHYRNLDYNQNNSVVANDIMLIRLAEPVRDVPLVQLNEDEQVPRDFEELITVGFGFTSLEGDLPTQLLEVEMNSIPSESCFEDLQLFENVQPGPGLLCAGSRTGQASTCNGDSGGPLMTLDGLVQVGVTSFGVNCDTINLPNGFTRVSYYSDWIKETICKYSNDRPSDCPEPEGPDPGAVPINVTIRHDYFPAETTWAIRDRSDNSIKVAGPIGNPTPGSLWYTTVALVPGDYTFEVYDQRGDGMGSLLPENAGFFELSTNVSGASEVLVPLTLGYFEFILATDFEVPETLVASPTRSPVSGFSEYEDSPGAKSVVPTTIESGTLSSAPSFAPSPLLSPSNNSDPGASQLPSGGESQEGVDNSPILTSNALNSFPWSRYFLTSIFGLPGLLMLLTT